HQTVALLAPFAGVGTVEAEQGVVTGEAPLTPIQSWFYGLDLPERNHFNQSVLLDVSGVDRQTLDAAVRALLTHHDALRLRSDGTRQWFAEPDGQGLEDADGRTADDVQASLDLVDGPVTRFVLISEDRLLIAVHHMAVDGVSWRILLEDLAATYAGTPLAPKTTPFKEWAQRLQHAADDSEIPYWNDVPALDLPVDHSDGDNTVASSETVTLELDEDETRALLTQVPAAYRTQINDVLLTALAQTLAGWTGQDTVTVALEGHGREELFDDVDVSRTVGWFTSLFPVALTPGADRPGEALKAVKEQLRAVPRRGVGYGLTHDLTALPAGLSFNYLGQLDSLSSDQGPFRVAAEPMGAVAGDGGRRPHLIDVTGAVAGGRLGLSWTYSAALHDRATITRLAEDFAAGLRALIEHCLTPDAGGLTPSDVPLAGLDQQALDALAADSVEDVHPLSPLQQGILFHGMLDEGAGVYFQRVRWSIEGDLDVDRMKAAWQATVDRHAMLRTSVRLRDTGEPLQLVHRGVRLPFGHEDLSGLDPRSREHAIDRFMEEDRRRGFDLAQAPLTRVHLVRTGPSEHQLIWSFHHLLLDGWSTATLLGEVLARYIDPAWEPSHRVRPYGDFISWLHDREADAAENYWRTRLDGWDEATPLGVDRTVRGDEPEGEPGSLRFELPAEATERIRQFARARHLTLNTLSQAAWGLLLARYGDRDDVVFGTTVSGRPPALPGVENMVGLFINTLPVRMRIDGEQRVEDWLAEVQRVQAEMRQFEHTPLAQVRRWSGAAPDESLFESLLVFENYPVDTVPGSGGDEDRLTIRPIEVREHTNYPLSMAVMADTVLTGDISYDRRRFDAAAIRRLAGHYRVLLEAIVAAPRARVDELTPVTVGERTNLLETLNAGTGARPPAYPVHEWFAEQAELRPDAVAITYEGEELTYRQLDEWADRIAQRLLATGRVHEETPVAVCMERSPAWVAALLGVFRAGAVYVPLDPAYPTQRLELILSDTRAPLVITGDGVALPTGHGAALVTVDNLRDGADDLPGGPLPDVPAGQLAYIVYTSGSTGLPKGVLVQHGGLTNLIAADIDEFGIGSGSVVLGFAPLSFDLSVQEALMTLCAGGRLVLAPSERLLPDQGLAGLLREQRVTVLQMPPQAWSGLDPEDVPDLKAALTGSDRVPADLVAAWANEGRRVLNVYGSTEATADSTVHRCDPADTGTPPVGRPIAGTAIYLLDSRLEPVPFGAAGEICIGGVGVARGYLSRPGLTAERFIADPFALDPGARMYRTGDQGRWRADGSLEFLGRADQQVKVRGFRVEPGEVEACLGAHPTVREVFVGTHERRLTAWIVPAAGREGLDLSALRAHAAAAMPPYMVPSHFIPVAELPLTRSGKIDRRALPMSDGARPALGVAYAAPRTPVERAIAAVWGEVLGIDEVGAHDNFLELGGDSILSIQVVTRLRTAFGVDLALRDVFDARDLADLAERLSGGGTSGARPALTRRPDGTGVLSFGQRRLWFIDQLEPGNSAYNSVSAMRLRGPLDIPALRTALETLAQRHEVLRSSFPVVDGVPTLSIAPGLPGLLTERDAGADWREAVSEEAARPFDLAAGPLFRALVVRVGVDDHVFVLSMHHAVSDGWSLGVLSDELSALYAAGVSGEPVSLPELPVQYADFAVWQRDWLSGEVLDGRLAVWRERLAGIPEVLELPIDRPRPAVQSLDGAAFTFTVPDHVTDAVRGIGREHDATLFMTLLSAFAVLLSRFSGQSDVVVGTPVAGRDGAELEGLVGFFVNTLVLRCDVSGDPEFGELLERVREVALEAYTHQDLPFERLVDELAPDRSLSHSPLFQVMFSQQNVPGGDPVLPGLTLEPVELPVSTTNFDLGLHVVDTGERLDAVIEYSTALFDESTVRRIADGYTHLLEQLAETANRPVSSLSVMSADEQRRVVEDWNDTAAPFPDGTSLHEVIAERARLAPGAVAVQAEGAVLTYGELDTRANAVAHALTAAGAERGAPVGVCMDRGLDLAVVLLGIWKAGAGYLPLDPGYPADRLAFMIDDAGAGTVITERSLAGRLPDFDGLLLRSEDLTGTAAKPPSVTVSPDDLAYVIYTSGSTGRPKGVAIEHGGLVQRVLSLQDRYSLSVTDRVLQKTPFTFDVSVLDLFWPLVAGSVVVMARPGGHTDAGYMAQIVTEERITVLHFVPSMLEALLDYGFIPPRDLRLVFCMGEALSTRLVDRFAALGDAELHDGYGPTEATIAMIFSAPEPGAEGAFVPIGRPIANTEIYIVDDTLEPVPVGVPGELCIGGIGIARGYLRRGGLTAERFVADPFSRRPGARLYRTGDLARYRADGVIEFLGRADQQVKVRGFRVEPGEIEEVLAGHPAVREAVVVADGGRLVAYLTPTGGSPLPGIPELRAFAGRSLPEYMVPAVFVVLEAMPLTPSGKLDRRALPAPDSGRLALDTGYVAPRTPTERVIAEVWSEVLDVDRVGVHDNFFELGGDSIMSVQLVSRARARGVGLSPKLVFDHQTVAALAAVAGVADIRAEQGVVTGEAPLTPIQQWFYGLRLPERNHFNQSVLLDVTGADHAALDLAVRSLLTHHDALRLRSDGSRMWFSEPDGQGLEDANGRTEDDVQASLDLMNGPVARFVRLSGERLLIAVHHMAVDGVSWRILVEDLATAYQQAQAGQKITPGAKTTSFKEWAHRLDQATDPDENKYWDSIPVTELPLDHPGERNTVASAESVVVELDEAETRALLTQVPAVYRTQINDVLLTALAQTLAAWTGQETVSVALEGHGREDLFDDVDVSRTVGWFTSLFPVALTPGDANPGSALKAVKEQLRAVPRRGVGYGLTHDLTALPTGLVFNYLGRFDTLTSAGLFAITDEPVGDTEASTGERAHLIDVNGAVSGGRLSLAWTYSSNLHDRATVEGLAEDFVVRLRELIEHCLTEESGGLTPSDVPLARLDQASLDRLMAGDRQIEDVYPLSPLQHGMLFHALAEPDSGMYVEQIHWRLEGDLDVDRMRGAWQNVLDRHPILRTEFVWEGVPRPLQVVRAGVPVPFEYHDLSPMAVDGREPHITRLLEQDRVEGFDFGAAPLMKVRVLRTDESQYHLVWSFHHVLLDGWSVTAVLGEVFASYSGTALAADGRSYREFIGWLGEQDLGAAQAYWREALAGFETPTALPGDGSGAGVGPGVADTEPGRVGAVLSAEAAAGLGSVARAARVTVASVAQAAWGLVLSRFGGGSDVVFGTTVSGRPAGLDGVEEMVGLFINTLPVRVRVDERATVVDLLRRVQDDQ
ncbi:non-ribosomal peptide synthetase, partial [Streptomyces sp. CS014]|uniref:non-ribosomal peptide synthetase n=1 Tax=Streptomyces sp. CS014 TaxID=2162707 RepID=UPI0013A5B0DC